eukprot:evm.model.scf_717.7 EVM.evm.TU.scf_717.7   scf_717:59045-61300(+)
MDWDDVDPTELLASLQEAEWKDPPRPLSDFFGTFKPPKDGKALRSRLKCNLYYYRTNYALVFPPVLLAFVLRNPGALLAIATTGFCALLCNDSFARSTNDQIVRWVRKYDPALAQRLRAANRPAEGARDPKTRTKPPTKICGMDRSLVVMCLSGLSALLAFKFNSFQTLGWSLVTGSGLVLLHASFRVPNLKSRVKSVW